MQTATFFYFVLARRTAFFCEFASAKGKLLVWLLQASLKKAVELLKVYELKLQKSTVVDGAKPFAMKYFFGGCSSFRVRQAAFSAQHNSKPLLK